MGKKSELKRESKENNNKQTCCLVNHPAVFSFLSPVCMVFLPSPVDAAVILDIFLSYLQVTFSKRGRVREQKKKNKLRKKLNFIRERKQEEEEVVKKKKKKICVWLLARGGKKTRKSNGETTLCYLMSF
jgi:hypothetical protein